VASPVLPLEVDDAQDWRDPAVRLTAFLDAGSMRPLAPFDNSGVYIATGTVAGGRVVVYASDPQKIAYARVFPNAGQVGDEMALVITDETSLWTDADREAVAAYLLGLE